MAEIDYSTEQWRVIAGATAYAVSSYGRVKRLTKSKYSTDAGTILKSYRQKGYSRINLVYDDGSIKVRPCHRLVCEAFHGQPPTPQHHAAHINGDRSDNRPENLYWATAKENIADKNRHGTMARGDKSGRRLHPDRFPRGANSPLAKLTEEQVLEIRAAGKARGVRIRLAKQYGVSSSLISAIILCQRWKHL